jgi:hypothetical protein
MCVLDGVMELNKDGTVVRAFDVGLYVSQFDPR